MNQETEDKNYIIKYLNELIDDIDYEEATGIPRKIRRGEQGNVLEIKENGKNHEINILYNNKYDLYYPYLPEFHYLMVDNE